MSAKRTLAVGTGLAAGLGPIAYPLFRRWCITWGTRGDEATRKLPGDELLPDADLVTTRAITIDAPADAIWPWLVQMGSGRGGAYTYDWIENLLGLNMHSADEILPAVSRTSRSATTPAGTRPTGHAGRDPRPGAGAHDPDRRLNWVWIFALAARERVDQADQPEPDRHGGAAAGRPPVLPAVHGAGQPAHGAQDAARHQAARRMPVTTRPDSDYLTQGCPRYHAAWQTTIQTAMYWQANAATVQAWKTSWNPNHRGHGSGRLSP